MSLLRRSIVMLPLVLGACITEQDVMQATTVLGAPQGWNASFDNRAGVGLTSKNTHSGIAAAYLSAQNAAGATSAVLIQTITPTNYSGKRVRLSGWVKPVQLSGSDAGLWMRIDGENRLLGFDNMRSRQVFGTGDWYKVAIVLDVPTDAVGISFGAQIAGFGSMEVDDLVLEVVGAEVPLTVAQTAGVADTVSRTGWYLNSLDTPQNMGFEGSVPFGEGTRGWITRNAVSLTTTDPTAPLTDIASFGTMVGNAHVVGLGENTHGTREFQLEKHRYIRYLIESKGFTHVALEATFADAELINQYVLTGQGDPAKLLSALRLWINNTQEVLDLIKWIRQWNTTAPANARVQFYGFDFQQPGGALDSVEAYIGRVDAANSAYVRQRYLCFDPHKSYGSSYGAPIGGYALRLPTSRAACALGAKEVNELFVNSKVAYIARSSADQYERALHSTRLVQQWEAFGSTLTNSTLSNVSRDASMFENVQFIRARGGPDSKIVLWAHNDHIQRSGNLMGGLLSRALAKDYVAMGFAFGDGTFNAVSSESVQIVRPAPTPTDWIEPRFGAAKPSNFLLDLRLVAGGGADAAPLLGPFPMRNVGSTYSLTFPAGFYKVYYLPQSFDLITYIHSATETKLLPFAF